MSNTVTEPRLGTFALYRRVFRQVRPYRVHLTGMLLLGLLSTPIALLMPLPLKLAVDSVLGGHPLPALLTQVVPGAAALTVDGLLLLVAGMILAVALVNQIHTVFDWVLRDYTSERIHNDFRARLFLHVQHLSLIHHDTKGSADAIFRIEHDAGALHWVVILVVLPFVTAAVSLGGMIWVMALLNLKIALVALTISPLLFLVTMLYRRSLRDKWHAVHERECEVTAVVHEVLGALRVVKTFGQEEREQNRFLARAGVKLKARVSAALSESALSFMVGLLLASGTAAVLYIGVRDVQSGALTVGDLLLVMAYLAQLYGPLHTMGEQIASQQKALASLERAFAVLDEAPAPPDRPDARPIVRATGAIAFRNVGFAYNDRHTTLHDVSFEAPAGSRVGIVGKTGAGKSSLIALLIRLYDPTTGAITLDGTDLRDYRLSDLRRQFGVVSQDATLFSTTLAGNIAYARPDASMDDIVAAARAANAHDFISALPQGYETTVGERGVRLSGGERQRIALARAFLKDAPLLILDEPTSAVDVRTEQAILGGIERLMEGRTTFMITHRLATLRECDRLLVLEAGRLIKATADVAGTVNQLMVPVAE